MKRFVHHSQIMPNKTLQRNPKLLTQCGLEKKCIKKTICIKNDWSYIMWYELINLTENKTDILFDF